MPQQSINALDRRSYSSQNDYIGNSVVSSTEQKIAVTDIISEGPIEGLVNGGQSVFLNNDPMFSAEEAPYRDSTAKAIITNGSKNVTVTSLDAFNVRKGAAKKYLHVIERYKIIARVTEYTVQAPFTAFSTSFAGLTKGTLTRQSGDPFLTAWNKNTAADVVGTNPVLTDGFMINIKTASGKFFEDINLSAIASNTDNVCTFNTDSFFPLFEDDEWGDGNTTDHTITVDLFLEIESIDTANNKVVLKQAADFGSTEGYSFGITGPTFEANNTAETPGKHSGASVRFNPGTLEQKALATLEGVGTSSVALSVTNAALEKFNGSNYTTITATGAQASQIDEVKLVIQYPQGCYLQVDRSGTLYPAGVGYHIEMKINNGVDTGYREVLPPKNGGSVTAKRFDSTRSATQPHDNTNADSTVWAFAYKKRSKFSDEIRIPLEGFQPFEGFTIRISRITKHLPDDYTAENRFAPTRGEGGIDSDLKGSKGGQAAVNSGGEDKHHTGVYTSSLTQALGIIKERLNYPYTAFAHTSFSSKSFQQNPTRAYECRGLKVKVPKNYITREENDGINAKYTRNSETAAVSTMTTPQLWDGTFRDDRIYTDNPAWVFYDICTNDRYGLGDFLLESDIDKFSLYKVAKYCDELVPDGKGGSEPRFRSNIYLTKATDAYKILKDFATVFRGILYWSNSQFVTVIDEPKEPIFNFTRGNVIDGSFEYQSTGTKTRTNQVIVNWNNPKTDYKIEPLIIEDRENIIQTGTIKSEKAVAFGCTSEGQAIRYGRWKLWTAVNQTELVAFKTSINASFLSPGDIINIQDEAEYSVPFSGRVSSYDASTPNITLDRAISSHFAGSGYEYTISVLLPKRTIVLNQESATIALSGGGQQIFNRGEEVTHATVGGSVVELLNANEDTTNRNIVSAVDTSGDSINLQYIEHTVVEERVLTHGSVTTSNDKDTIPIASAFSVAPTNGDIWAIKETSTTTSDTTAVSYKQYKILDIAESDKTEYAITAVEHYNTKFDSVDKELVLSDPDPIYSREDTSADVPSPQNVRVIRTPRDNVPGEELVLEWDAPSIQTTDPDAQNAFTEYEHLAEYEIEHTFGGKTGYPDTFRVERGNRNVEFVNVEDGSHRVSIRTISRGGRRSAPAIFDIIVEDIFEGSHQRLGGISLGGYATRDIEVVDDGTQKGTVKFTGIDYVAAPFTGIRGAKSNTQADADSYSLSITELASNSWPASGSESQGYVFLDFSEVDKANPNANALKLIVRKLDTTTFGSAIDYWYDAKKYIADNNSIWTSVGNVAVTQGSSTITGSGFSNLEVPQVVKIGTSFAGKVGLIRSDTEMYLDRPWTASDNASIALSKQELTIDYIKDFILGSVKYTATGTTYSLDVNYLQITPNLNVTPRAIVAPITPATLNYETDGTLSTTYSNIKIDVTAVGYQYAEIKVTGAGFSQTNQSADTGYVEGNTRSVTVHSDNSAIAYSSGTALNFTIEVREKLDPDNTAKQLSRVVSLVKMKDGDEGAEGAEGLDAVSVNWVVGHLTYQESGTDDWDPASTVTVKAEVSGLTGITYSSWATDSGTIGNSNANTQTLTGASNRTNTQANALRDGGVQVSVNIAGTRSDGSTAYSATTFSHKIAVIKEVKGDQGGPGFFFLKRNDPGVTKDVAGEELGKPDGSEVANPAVGNIAIVENTPTDGSDPTQAAYEFESGSPNAWAEVTNFFRADVIAAGAIGAKQLAISNNQSSGSGIYMNSNTNNQYAIEIYDNDSLRVKIGYIT